MSMYLPEELWAMMAAAKAIVQLPYQDWSVQGFGMMRTYLDDKHEYRLNVWHSALATENVSLIHDHPWALKSWVIAGKIINTIYAEGNGVLRTPGLWYEWGLLVPGPDGGQMTPGSPVRMYEESRMDYRPGDTYEQTMEQVHKTEFVDGTVTLNWRHGRSEQDLARVFWPAGSKWVDAKPRRATPQEIMDTCKAAVDMFPK